MKSLNSYLRRAWNDLSSDEGWWRVILVLGLLNCVPLVGQVFMLGYVYDWAKEAAWGMKGGPSHDSGDIGRRGKYGLMVLGVLFVWTAPIIIVAELLRFVPIVGGVLCFLVDLLCIIVSVVASAAALRKTIASSETSIAGEKTRIASDKAAAVEDAKRCGLPDATLEGIKAARGECEARIDASDTKLAEICEQEKKVKTLQAEIKKLVKAKDTAADSKTEAEKRVSDCENQIKIHQASIDATDKQEKEKLADVSGKVSIPRWLESWERDAEKIEADFKTAANGYTAHKAALPKAESRLASLTNAGSQIADCVRRAVAEVGALAEVACGEVAAESTAEVEGLLGRFMETKNAMEKHRAERPAGLQETDTIADLSNRDSEIKAQENDFSMERGRCQQRIADDDARAVERAAKREKADKLRAALAEWNPIYACYGDADGKKIRREIQSYVLMNVLKTANYYLRQLSERYELSCEGLTLSVTDAFEGGAVRPVNTLSGGEQFLVSLALALGLAGMNDTGLGVDMLLIDEGFGTLSGEHLNCAVEALERLNALTGSRKVGVISHVERLRERIRTHIEVTRNGHDPSDVRVVCG